MIVKVSTKKPDTQSSFGRLAKYISDAPRDGEKVLDSWGANVYSEDLESMIDEVVFTQAQNQNTQSDKTYHLIVSFPAGEQPDSAVLKDIDQQIAESLGLADNERFVAVHDDTAHLHMHIAINKVHPETFKLITPYRDFKTLNAVSRELELKHGLQVLEPEKSRENASQPPSERANDVEQHGKTVSFNSWAIDTLRGPLARILNDKTASWADFHEGLAAKGLKIKPRGRGFIITTANERLFVKPSDIHRDLSRAKLEAKFGEFHAFEGKLARCPYKKQPLNPTPDTKKLFSAYQKHKTGLAAQRKAAFADYKAQKDATFRAIRAEFAEKRREFNRRTDIHKSKKGDISRKIAVNRKKALENARLELAEQRLGIMTQYQTPSWTDYLLQHAAEGDDIARQALVSREKRHKPVGNRITAESLISRAQSLYLKGGGHALPAHPKVNKNGTLTYALANRDKLVVDENTIHVYGQRDDTLKAALTAAQKQYGNRLKLTGDKAFLESCHAAIKKHGLKIDIQQEHTR